MEWKNLLIILLLLISPGVTIGAIPGDIDEDGDVDFDDFFILADNFGAKTTEDPFLGTLCIPEDPLCGIPDLNGDEIVNWDDFFIFVDDFGTSAPESIPGDIDEDGDVDFDDFFIFSDNFGKTEN